MSEIDTRFNKLIDEIIKVSPIVVPHKKWVSGVPSLSYTWLNTNKVNCNVMVHLTGIKDFPLRMSVQVNAWLDFTDTRKWIFKEISNLSEEQIALLIDSLNEAFEMADSIKEDELTNTAPLNKGG